MKKYYLLYLLLFIFPLGQLGRIDRIGDTSILLNDVILGILMGSWLITLTVKRKLPKVNRLGKFMLGFTLVGLFSLLFNFNRYTFDQLIISSLYLLRFFSYGLIYLFIINEKPDAQRLTKYLPYPILVVALLGAFQYFFLPDLSFMNKWGWDPHLFRLAAPFFDPAFTGAILALGLFFIASKYLNGKADKNSIFMAVIIYIALALTYARSAYVMYLAGMIILALLKKNWKFGLIVLFIGLLTILLLPQQKSYGTNLVREETISARLINWQQSFMIWKNQPLFGIGFNAYRYAKPKYGIKDLSAEVNNAGAGADSSILFVAATTGFFGLVVYLGMFFNLLSYAYHHKDNYLSLCLFISLAGFLVHSLFANSLFYPFVMEWIWIIAGMVYLPYSRGNS